MSAPDEQYMRRCIALALQGLGYTAPNPMVGAILVYNDRIIGEGYHAKYGQAHAEVNCISSVAEEDKQYIPSSVLYVSLEPCVHFGKTPPCADLIIQNRIPKVVIGCRDPFSEVNGRGIEKLADAGIEVIAGVLEQECMELNKRFFIFHTEHRPYVILKWAQTINGRIGTGTIERLMITNPETNRKVHKWRSEEASVLVGTQTALLDDPSLDNRLWTGNSPVRLVLDLSLRLPQVLKIYNQQQRTVIFNLQSDEETGNLRYYRFQKETELIPQILSACYELQLQSILVEGGTRLIQSFIDTGSWDEIRVTTNDHMMVETGIEAPVLPPMECWYSEKIISDTIRYYKNPKQTTA
jgi:diaminohydroxyphosphoribosylaminopyrimidine deaminase/5-amino-6-(5-phosphoribosylamino)uracil reductase